MTSSVYRPISKITNALGTSNKYILTKYYSKSCKNTCQEKGKVKSFKLPLVPEAAAGSAGILTAADIKMVQKMSPISRY